MTIAQMREALKKAPKYSHNPRSVATWSAKVDRMSDMQVLAVYSRMMRAGELG